MKTDTSIFEIDQDRLDYEWMRQAKLYGQQADECALAQKDLDVAKSELELVQADLAHSIRVTPEAHGLVKVTEGAIQENILRSKKYQTANEHFIEMKYRVNLLKGHLEALDHKKKALESLVFLHGQNYFAEPKANGVGKEVANEIEKKSVRKMGKS